MKYILPLLFLVQLFYSCVSDEERRLQTDQSFEGEEIFSLSFSMDEHLFFAFHPLSYYQDTLNHSNIPGCPLVSINETGREVVLAFGDNECEASMPVRTGKLKLIYQDSLTYQDSLIQKERLVRMDYENYNVNGAGLTGLRLLYPVDSSSSEITFKDHPKELVFKQANGSSSKISGDFTHVVQFSMDSIIQVTSLGGGSGRNQAGRRFTLEISQSKQFDGACIRTGKLIPATGRESWTIERTVAPDVTHELVYHAGEDCSHQAKIQLFDGRELEKSQ